MRRTDRIQFRVFGKPVAQPRPKAASRGQRIVVYDPGTADEWKALVKRAALRVWEPVPLEGALEVNATFLFPRPKRLLGKRAFAGRIPHVSTPDRDNLDKAVLDALTDLGLWADDAQVMSGRVSKWYVAIGEEPGAVVTIQRVEGTP